MRAAKTLLGDAWTSTWVFGDLAIERVPRSSMIEINGVRGFLIPGDVAELWRVASEMPPGGRYVEIGSWMGLSAILVANAFLATLNLESRVYCVDTWEGSDEHRDFEEVKAGTLFDIFRDNVSRSRMDHFISPRRGRSVEIARTFENSSLDVVFLDGDHSYDACLADIESWYPKLKPSGRFLGHDAAQDGPVRRAVAEFCGTRGLQFSVISPPAAHYLWEIQRVDGTCQNCQS